MKTFLSRFQSLIYCVLSGFDRLRFCGESRLLNHQRGVQSYLHQRRIPFKDFDSHARKLTEQFRAEANRRRADVPCQYLNSPDIDKEARALQLARAHGLTSGPIAFLTCLENARTYRKRGNADGHVEPRSEKTRCLHHYHYFLHPQFGLCYVRIQTWFPFSVRVGLNGRRWLAQRLRQRRHAVEERGNLITAMDDVSLAQRLLREQTRADWPRLLADLVRPVHPLWGYLHETVDTPFYWMAEQTEWATDYLFHSRADLAAWYPRWIRHALDTLSCKDVLRYLGKKVPQDGYGLFGQEGKIDLRTRAEGTRLKFWYGTNALKIYDKEGIALRLETTINDPSMFKVYRTKEGAPPDADKSWQQLRKGVADLHRRAEVSAAANQRLADSLATVADATTLGQLLEPLGQPVVVDGRRVARALNPLTGGDGTLLRALAQGDYLLNGFRNRDVRVTLFGWGTDPSMRRRQAAKVTRLLGLLRAHGLIVKVHKTHRYRLSAHGQRITTALLAAHATKAEQFTNVA